MTDPDWDIPGISREPSPCSNATESSAAGLSAAGSATSASPDAASPGRGRKSGRRRRTTSASACAGSSAGAFARLADATSYVAWSVSSPGSVAPCTAAAGTESSRSGPGGTGSAAVATDSSHGTALASARGHSATSASAGAHGAVSHGAVSHGAESAIGALRAADPVQALAFLKAGLEFLAQANPAGWNEGLQADCLRALAVAESRQTAAHARILQAFSAPGGGLAGDGHRSPRMWLTWQTHATRRAAATKVSWMHRLSAHPAVAAALGDAGVSVSWAQQIMDWTRRLPDDVVDDADAELLAAAMNGASLGDLAQIAEELRREHAKPDEDSDGFEDRGMRLSTTFGGAGRLEGDLTARCAAAAEAVLDALGRPFGPEDTRTLAQRQHDAFEEAMMRLISAGLLPQQAGRPVRLELDITLDQLANGGAGSVAGPGSACDAVIQPVITGMVDYGLLARYGDPEHPDWRHEVEQAAARKAAEAPWEQVIAQAVAYLSGPQGRAAWLRANATGEIPSSGVSLPLDVASAIETIPRHLRRAVRKRDRHCRFPGCDLPAAGCEVHHITPRRDGGRHALSNLALLCRFHHLIAIHRWGWVFILHADGTTTAVSPDGTKTLHSHAPPTAAA